MKTGTKLCGVIAAAAVLFALTGCPNNTVSSRDPMLTGVTVTDDDGPVPAAITLNVGGTKSVTAAATGGKDVTFAWTVAGDAQVAGLSQNTGAQVTVTGYEEGEVTVTVTATNSDRTTKEASFDVYVLPAGRDWTFSILDGTRAIRAGGELIIAPKQAKSVRLQAIPSAETLTYTWATNDDEIASLGAVSGSPVTVTAGPDPDETVITITAAKDVGNTFQKTFTVKVANDPWLLAEWSSAVSPMDSLNNNDSARVPGFPPALTFRSRGVTIPVSGGAFVLGNSTQAQRLVLGGVTNQSNNSSATRHRPGMFDLSEGMFRITVKYKDINRNPPGDDIGGFLSVRINNNSEGLASNVLGNTCLLCTFRPSQLQTGATSGGMTNEGVEAVAGNGQIVITVNPAIRFANVSGTYQLDEFSEPFNNIDSLKTAFICFFSGYDVNSSSTVTITDIKVERIE